MKYSQKVNAPQDFLYQKMIDSALYDIKQSTGKKVSESQLTGFEYEKKISGQTVEMLINEATAPSVYEFTATTSARTHHTRWELTKISELETEIHITDTQGTASVFQLFTDKLMEFLLTKPKRRQMETMLTKMEKEYQKSGAAS